MYYISVERENGKLSNGVNITGVHELLKELLRFKQLEVGIVEIGCPGSNFDNRGSTFPQQCLSLNYPFSNTF